MSCSHVSQSLINDDDVSLFASDALEHVKDCRSCQELIRELTTQVSCPQPSPKILQRIEHALTHDLRSVKPLAPVRHAFITLSSLLVVLVFLIAHRLRAFGISAMNAAQLAGVFGVISMNAGMSIHSLLCQVAPGSRHRVSPRLLPTAVIASLIFVTSVSFQFQQEADFWSWGWVCLNLGLAVGGLAALPIWLVLRRGIVLYPAMTGAVTGLIAGLAGTSVLEIHCPNLNAWHKVVWHLGVALVCSLAGLGLGLLSESRQSSEHNDILKSHYLRTGESTYEHKTDCGLPTADRHRRF
jgi:hypothetical protein